MLLPDPPEIREAELFGYPPDPIPDPVCPVCGEVDPEYIYKMEGTVIGCSHCIERMDGGDYAVEQYERSLEDHE